MAKSVKFDKKTKKSKPAKKSKPPRVSYHRRPEDLQLDLWQMGLRKQFGEENEFHVANTGTDPIFSEFIVWNPATQNSYTVTLRTDYPKKGLPKPNTPTHIGNRCNCPDFKTNRLGLCKHISAALYLARKKRGAIKMLAAGFRPPLSEIYVDYRNEPQIRLYVGAEQESKLLKWAGKWFDPDGLLPEKHAEDFEQILEEARKIEPQLRCQDDALDLIARLRENNRRKSILANTMPKGPDSPDLDSLLKVRLFPYQKRGVWFAANAGRCLIADEMGLGKTIQAIGAAELLRKHIGLQRVLVVCPTSLKYQWKSEIEKFTNAQVLVVEGMQPKRIRQYELGEAVYYIVSYNTILYDADLLDILDADLLIADEAQRIKNFRTKVSVQLKKVQTPYCFVLTGTPLENKMEDLYALMQFVDQYKLPPLYRFLDRYQILGDNGQVVGYKNLKEIGEILSDCMIRRVKKEVLRDLPLRMDKILFVPMTKQQSEIHHELADSVARLVAKWRRQHFLSETDRRMLILSLSQMRMVADSTFILDQKTRFDTKIAELMYIFEEALADPEQKIVVFSQWERMTRLVAQELDERKIGYAYLHGGVHSTARADLFERFREDEQCRIFLSTDAGGVGLNLQSASLLINLDVPWNPAMLEQRVGRIHRMGQRKNVRVINMVSSGSIEERMLDILQFKSSMAQGVLDPDGDDTIFMSESKFKKFMENVESLTGEGWQAPPTETPDPATLDSADEMNPAPEKPRPKPAEPTAPPPHAAAKPAPQKNLQPAAAQNRLPAAAPSTPQELIESGVSFFSGLAQTLSSPEKTQELVQSILATDEETGQTYLKIPVENAAAVENAVKLLGGLLAGLGR